MSYESTLVKSNLSEDVSDQAKFENLSILRSNDWTDMFNRTMIYDALGYDDLYGFLTQSQHDLLQARVDKNVSAIPYYSDFQFTYSGTQGFFTFKLPVGDSVLIDWGDGIFHTYAGQGNNPIVASSYYATNGKYNIRIYDDYLKITHLDISGQTFSGDAVSLATWRNINYLDVSGTNLTGSVAGWSVLNLLTHLDISSSSVSGSAAGWSTLTALTHLDVSSTFVSGSVAGWSALTSLTYLDASNTSVSGSAATWSALTALTYLDISSTSISGTITPWVDITSLTHLDVNATSVAGSVATWGAALTSLTYIDCSSTSLTGSVVDFADATGMLHIDFADTTVSGAVNGWTAMTGVTYIDLDGTSVSGAVNGWSALTTLTYIAVGGTSVTGAINGWSALTVLTHLDVNDTALSGSVSDWTALIALVYVDISDSSCTGSIEDFFFKMPALSYIDCENIPVTGQFEDFVDWTPSVREVTIKLRNTNVSGNVSWFREFSTNLVVLDLGDGNAAGNAALANNLSNCREFKIDNIAANWGTSPPFPLADGAVFWAHDNAMSENEVDFCLYSLYTGAVTNCTIRLDGDNAARTATSDTAYNWLIANGNTIALS